jgi:hypothetical protein
MPNYLVNYRVWSDFQTVIEADTKEQVEEIILSGKVTDYETDFIASDLDYDYYDISEVEL